MDEIQPPAPQKTPGIVLFVSILNFLSAAGGFLVALLSLAMLALGAGAGVYEKVANQLAQAQPPISLSFGVTFFFLILFTLSAVFGAYFFAIGLGLLKRKKIAWYAQVAMSVLGLLGFPFGTAVNALILIFFFQAPVREHFKV